MVRILLLLLLLSAAATAQLPEPPPLTPLPVPGEAPPFDPNHTREAVPLPELKLRSPEPPGQDVPETPVTLIEAIELAWRLTPDVREAEGQLRQAEGNLVTRRAPLLPNIGATSTFARIITDSGGGGGVIVGNQVVGGNGGGGSNTTDRLNTRIGLNQLLFDFGRTRNLVLQADLLRQSAAADLLMTKNDVALQVKENYYNLVRALQLLQVRENDLANRQQQLRLARALYEAGEMAPGDVVRAQSAVTNSVVALNSARLDLQTAEQDLVQSLGLPPLQEVIFEGFHEPDLPTKEVSYLLEQARGRRPDLLSSLRDLEARKAGLGAAYALNRPELSAFTGITFQGAPDGKQVPTITAELSLSFDLYDGGARAGAVTSAEGAVEVSQAQLQRTHLQVERLVGGLLAALVTAERNVDAAQAGVDSAREGVRIAEGRYRVALGSLTDVLDAQTAFVQAQTNLANSLASLDLARARLRHALASPIEEGFVQQDVFELDPPAD